MTLASTFVDLFHLLLLKVLDDDLAHEQPPLIDAHLCLHAFVHCSFDVVSLLQTPLRGVGTGIFAMFFAMSVDETSAEFLVIVRSSTSMKYLILLC